MKRLWSASIEYRVIVIADTEEDARDLVELHARDELENVTLTDEVIVAEVTSLQGVAGSWLDSIPYGTADDLTVRQILHDQSIVTDDKTPKLFR